MRFLLVGNGAREHAIAEAVCRNSEVKLFAFMSARNPGIARLCEKSKGAFAMGDIHSPKAVSEWAVSQKIELAFASPDAVLEAGVSGALIAAGIATASPVKEAARLEWDKSFARNLMEKHGIRGCPKFGIFKDAGAAGKFIDALREVAVKPSGLTGGKGVKVTGYQLKDAEEAKKYAEEVLASNMGGLGEVVIEERLFGEEFTLQSFVDGKNVVGMPAVQDHKRAYKGDEGPNCYSEDTEILTEDGWERFGDLKRSERVATFQPGFKRIRFEKPKAVYWRKYKGKMINFKHREIDLLVTPNHRMLVQRRKDKRKRWRVIEAKDWKGENFIPQTGRWIGTSRKLFIVPKSKNHYGVKRKSIKIKFEDWTAFLGLYLSEGFVSEHGGRVHIAQTRSSKNFTKMKKILNRLPFKVTYEKDRFRINSRQLADCLVGFGYSHEKFVPSYIKDAKPEIIEIFLNAFCLGDGDIHYGQMRFCSSSKRMIGDLQELFLKTRKVGIITIDKRKTMLNPINKRYYPARPIYAMEVKKRTKTSIRKNNVREVDYNGFIGCVTVSTGFVVVRRNNRVAICGNTGGMGSYTGAGHLLPFITQKDYDDALRIMRSTISAFREETGKEFKGVLYGQFIAGKNGVEVIEYNSRFGDPEAMNVLALLESDLADIFTKMAKGELKESDVKFAKKATVCKYLVPEGYPVKSVKDQPLEINEAEIAKAGARLYYASVDEREGLVYTGSSRSIGVLGIGASIGEAEKKAEAACSFVKGRVWHREDIGTGALVEKRVEHMKELRGK